MPEGLHTADVVHLFLLKLIVSMIRECFAPSKLYREKANNYGVECGITYKASLKKILCITIVARGEEMAGSFTLKFRSTSFRLGIRCIFIAKRLRPSDGKSYNLYTLNLNKSEIQ